MAHKMAITHAHTHALYDIHYITVTSAWFTGISIVKYTGPSIALQAGMIG